MLWGLALFLLVPQLGALQQYPGISEAFIEKHEEAAELALALALITGAAAGLSIVVWNFSLRKWMLVGVFLMSVVNTVSLGYVAHLGGQIRHIELRDPNSSVGPSEAE
ncbi:hypothetical protein EBZ35_09145 [bacterium]|nr:hypothetical protein [bacterium]